DELVTGVQTVALPILSEPVLSVEHVHKAFGGIQAVQDCTFDVMPGVITGLIGPNGAGKTTIFNLITGFLHADAGSIRLRGTQLRDRESVVWGVCGVEW